MMVGQRSIDNSTQLDFSHHVGREYHCCLDEDIDPQHSILADRHDVVYELRYSQLVDILNENNGVTDNENDNSENDGGSAKLVSQELTEAIDNTIAMKNGKRSTLGKEELADWYKQYALLQGKWELALLQLHHTHCNIQMMYKILCHLHFFNRNYRSYEGSIQKDLGRSYCCTCNGGHRRV